MSAATEDLAKRLLEAASWQMRLAEGDAELEAEFELWRVDPANAAAWDRMLAPWALIGEHANETKMVAYRQEALNDAKTTSTALNRDARWRPRRHVLAAATVAAALGIAGYRLWIAPPDYATVFGERRTVDLPDGSKVSLDSDSEVTVHYGGNARELHLLKGQARFDVAHDLERPFSVIARDQKVIATGTAFNIDMTQRKVLITLIEGHVVVVDKGAPASSVTLAEHAPYKALELEAGQQLVALPDKPPSIAPGNIQSAVAWTRGQLVFDDQPLSDVVARVNHYATTPIIIADKSASALRISGSFNTGDVTGFVDIVTRYLPLKEEVDADGRITLRKK